MGAPKGNRNRAPNNIYPRRVVSLSGLEYDAAMGLLEKQGISDPSDKEILDAMRGLPVISAEEHLSNDVPENQASHRAASHDRRLLTDGLARLGEGKAPTRTQLPLVQEYMQGHRAEIDRLKQAVKGAEIEKSVVEEHLQRFIPQWNSIFGVLKEFDVTLYEGKGSHGWSSANGNEGEDGFESLADALRSALAWRIEQKG